MTPTIDSIVGVIPNEGLEGSVCQTFFWYDKDKEDRFSHDMAHISLMHSQKKKVGIPLFVYQFIGAVLR